MLILASARELPKWDASSLQSVLGHLRRSDAALVIEWDLGAGEGWCRVREEVDIVAFVRAPTTARSATRFVFIHRQHSKAAMLKAFFGARQAEVVQVDDFDGEALSISREDLAAFTDGEVAPEHVFNPDLFAANDLVFVTE
jgi:hypothetical protein